VKKQFGKKEQTRNIEINKNPEGSCNKVKWCSFEYSERDIVLRIVSQYSKNEMDHYSLTPVHTLDEYHHQDRTVPCHSSPNHCGTP